MELELPEREWYSISDASIRLEISQERVEHYLETGKLLASVRLPLTTLNCMDDIAPHAIGFDDVEDFDDFSQIYVTDVWEGIFLITRYDRIRWDLDNSCDLYTNDISLCEHCNWKHLVVLKFSDSYVVRKNEIIIEEQSIQKFLNKYCDGVTLHTNATSLEQPQQSINIPPYLDEHSTRYFSQELAIAVSAWMAIYHNKDGLKKYRSHKSQIISWIEKNRPPDYVLSGEAIKRIATMINYDKRNKRT